VYGSLALYGTSHARGHLPQWRERQAAISNFIFDEKSLHWSAIPDCEMGIGFLGSSHHDAPYHQVPLSILHFGCAGRFLCSIVH